MKGQSSIEFLIVIGVALVLAAPFVINAQDSLINVVQGSEAAEFEASLNEFADAVQKVDEMGEPAKTTFELNIPTEIEDVTKTAGSEAVIYTVRRRGESVNHTRIFETKVSGEMPGERGIYQGEVEAWEGQVNVSFGDSEVAETNRFFTDFSDYPDGDITDNDWSQVWDDGGTITVEPDGGAEGGKVLRFDSDVSFSDAVVWDGKGGENVEVFTRLIDVQDDRRAQPALRISGSSDDRNAYVLEQRTTVGDPTNISLAKYTDDAYQDLNRDEYSFGDLNFRFRTEGDNLMAKWWAPEETEPNEWNVAYTDTDHSSGGTGLIAQDREMEVDVFGVDLEGEEAPTEPVE